VHFYPFFTPFWPKKGPFSSTLSIKTVFRNHKKTLFFELRFRWHICHFWVPKNDPNRKNPKNTFFQLSKILHEKSAKIRKKRGLKNLAGQKWPISAKRRYFYGLNFRIFVRKSVILLFKKTVFFGVKTPLSSSILTPKKGQKWPFLTPKKTPFWPLFGSFWGSKTLYDFWCCRYFFSGQFLIKKKTQKRVILTPILTPVHFFKVFAGLVFPIFPKCNENVKNRFVDYNPEPHRLVKKPCLNDNSRVFWPLFDPFWTPFLWA